MENQSRAFSIVILYILISIKKYLKTRLIENFIKKIRIIKKTNENNLSKTWVLIVYTHHPILPLPLRIQKIVINYVEPRLFYPNLTSIYYRDNIIIIFFFNFRWQFLYSMFWNVIFYIQVFLVLSPKFLFDLNINIY